MEEPPVEQAVKSQGIGEPALKAQGSGELAMRWSGSNVLAMGAGWDQGTQQCDGRELRIVANGRTSRSERRVPCFQ